MEARDHPNSPAQIFAWRKEVRARLIADRLSIDPADRRQYAGKIALHLSRFIEPLSKRTVSFYWPFRGEPDLRPLMQTVVEGGGRCALPVIVEKKLHLSFAFGNLAKDSQPAFGIFQSPLTAPTCCQTLWSHR
jgi:5,10-methenyltetrahydrofolate synthetase